MNSVIIKCKYHNMIFSFCVCQHYKYVNNEMSNCKYHGMIIGFCMCQHPVQLYTTERCAAQVRTMYYECRT